MPGRCLFAGTGSVYSFESIKGKIVFDMKELDRYSYSGHSALMGKKERQWQDVDYVLGFFGRRVGEA
jgi:hypothetical protein